MRRMMFLLMALAAVSSEAFDVERNKPPEDPQPANVSDSMTADAITLFAFMRRLA